MTCNLRHPMALHNPVFTKYVFIKYLFTKCVFTKYVFTKYVSAKYVSVKMYSLNMFSLHMYWIYCISWSWPLKAQTIANKGIGGTAKIHFIWYFWGYILQYRSTSNEDVAIREGALQHTATYCNLLQLTATHCSTGLSQMKMVPIGKADYITLQLAATYCNLLQHRSKSNEDGANREGALQHTATSCNSLQHTATQV